MKSRLVAIMLAFFFGWLGLHKFYLGRQTAGLVYLVFCWFPLVWILGFVDMLVLAAMSDATFNERYNSEHYLPHPSQVRPQIRNVQGGAGARSQGVFAELDALLNPQPPVAPPPPDTSAAPSEISGWADLAGPGAPAPQAAAAPEPGLHWPSAPPATQPGSTADELYKLNELRIAGVLTEEEFEAEKKKLMAKPARF
jgi:TM2 domain-containing membrane protein YozV